MSLLRRALLRPDGRLRPGWAVLGFLLVAGLAVRGLVELLGQWGFGGRIVLTRGAALIPVSLARLAAPLFATWVGCWLVRQPLSAPGLFPSPGASRSLGAGLLWGAALVSAAVVIPWLAGQERFGGPVRPAPALLGAGLIQLAFLAPASAAEELYLRGFLLQQLALGLSALARGAFARGGPEGLARSDAFGRGAAVALTALAFGLLHGGNPAISRLAILNITLVGLWFGAVVVKNGSLWEAIGLHVGWNWCQGFVWGEPISGLPTGTSLLQRGPHGGAAWTGGDFGPEASAVTSVLLGVMLLATLAWRRR